jgi:hypothetical protein
MFSRTRRFSMTSRAKSLAFKPAVVLAVSLSVLAVATTSATAQPAPTWLGSTLKQLPGDPGLVTSTLACPKGISPLSGSCLLMGTPLSGFVTSGAAWDIADAVPGQERSLTADGVTLYPTSVSCPTASTCVVAGALHTGVSVLAWFTDGHLTKTVMVPDGQEVVLYAISCPNANLCVAVGHIKVGTSDVVTQGVVLAARSGVVGQPGRAVGTTVLDAVSCPSAAYCLAAGVGGSFVLSKGQPVFTSTELNTYGKIGATARLSNGSVAAVTTISAVTKLSAVSCAVAGYCTAVGTVAGGASAFVAVRSGAPDRAHSVPSQDSVGDVSCTSASLCTGVGSSLATSSHPEGLVYLADNGAVTDTFTLPAPGTLVHISCPVATYCLVQGAFGPFPGLAGTVVVKP